MVEHLLCKQGVIGSNPIVSTRVLALLRACGCWRFMGWFRHRLGWLAPESVGWRLGRVAAPGVLRGAGRVAVFFCYCESGSGALLGAQGISEVWLALRRWAGSREVARCDAG